MGTTWKRVHADPGGTVAALACAQRAEGQRVVIAATPVGLYLSENHLFNWYLTRTVPFAEAIAIHEQTMFVCAGDGVYRSSINADGWRQVLTGSQMLSVACSRDGLFVLVGTETDGTLRSDDGGTSWTGANAGLLDLNVTALALSPGFASDRLGFVGTPSGLYRTRNGAQSWRAIAPEFADSAIQCLAVSDKGVVLAGTESVGLLRSDDGGTTWSSAPLEAESVTAIAFGPDGRIAAATESGVALSHDSGETWRVSDVHSYAVLALTFVDETLLAGTHRHGVLLSDDSGWRPVNEDLNAHLVTTLLSTEDGALFTAGLDQGVRLSLDGGANWVERGLGLEDTVVFDLAISAEGTLVAATADGVHLSRDQGAGWERAFAESARLLATTEPLSMYAIVESGALRRSDDDGLTWRELATPFADTEVLSLAAAEGVVFVASRGAPGLAVWRSTDRGKSWQRWLVVDSTSSRDVVPLAVSAQYRFDERVYLGVGARVFSPLRGSRETSHGEQRPIWSATYVEGVGAILDLAVRRGTVFAATDAGVFISRDLSSSFHRWSDGLDDVPVVALAADPRENSILAVGLGGTIWQRANG